tara:strand:- start:1505 stop:1759 length:255 start_codon:yes stop_codon:yes gene_type:complete
MNDRTSYNRKELILLFQSRLLEIKKILEGIKVLKPDSYFPCQASKRRTNLLSLYDLNLTLLRIWDDGGKESAEAYKIISNLKST